MFIAVDGIDGAGKTTLVGNLAALLDGLDLLVTKEPTDRSEWGRRIRATASTGRLPQAEELEYFRRDRAFHCREIIGPALERGCWVISDRFVDSTLAFQCADPRQAEAVYREMLGEIIVPDLTLILDCPVETGLKRIQTNRRTTSTFENRATLDSAALIYASRTGPSYRHLDAANSAEHTLAQARGALAEVFADLRPLIEAGG